MRRLSLLFIICMLVGGCWNRVELNEIGIVSATGIDWVDNKWTLSYQVVIPQEISSQSVSGGSAAPVNVFSTSGESFRAATKRAGQESTRRLYYAHNQLIVIGQSAARHGLDQFFDVYLRNNDSRETVSVFLTKGSARRILEQLIPQEKIPGNAIQRLIEHEEQESSDFPQMTIHDVMVDLLGPVQATGIPSLTVGGTRENLDNTSKLAMTNTASKVRLSNLGLINKNKLVGWISEEESYGVMWLSDRIRHTTVPFACPDDGKGKNSSMKLYGASTKITPVWSGDKWKMHVKVQGQGRLLEYSCSDDLMQQKAREGIKAMVQEEIALLIDKGWQAVKKNQSDVVGFGSLIRRKYPLQWAQQKRDWAEHLSRIEIEVSVSIKIQSTGMSGNSFKDAQEKALN